MLCEFSLFKFFNSLNLGKFESFSNENLEDRFSFQFEIEKVIIFIVNLNDLDITLWVRNENWRGLKIILKEKTYWSINVIIGLQLVFINHVIIIT